MEDHIYSNEFNEGIYANADDTKEPIYENIEGAKPTLQEELKAKLSDKGNRESGYCSLNDYDCISVDDKQPSPRAGPLKDTIPSPRNVLGNGTISNHRVVNEASTQKKSADKTKPTTLPKPAHKISNTKAATGARVNQNRPTNVDEIDDTYVRGCMTTTSGILQNKKRSHQNGNTCPTSEFEEAYVLGRLVQQTEGSCNGRVYNAYDIRSGGGSVALNNVRVYFPENCSTVNNRTVLIGVSEKDEDKPKSHKYTNISKVVHLLPHGSRFEKPITTSVKFDRQTDKKNVFLLYSATDLGEPPDWELVPRRKKTKGGSLPSILNITSERCTFVMSHFCMVCAVEMGKGGQEAPIHAGLSWRFEHGSGSTGSIHVTMILSKDPIEDNRSNFQSRGVFKYVDELGMLEVTVTKMASNWTQDEDQSKQFSLTSRQLNHEAEAEFSFECTQIPDNAKFNATFRLHQEHADETCEKILQLNCRIPHSQRAPLNLGGTVVSLRAVFEQPHIHSQSRNEKLAKLHDLEPSPESTEVNNNTIQQASVNLLSMKISDTNNGSIQQNSYTTSGCSSATEGIESYEYIIGQIKHNPIRSTWLTESVMKKIANELDIDHPTGEDWTLLAEYLDQDVGLIRSRAALWKESPTVLLLRNWIVETRGNASKEILRNALKRIRRETVIKHIP